MPRYEKNSPELEVLMRNLDGSELTFLMSFGHCGIDWLHSIVLGHPDILILPEFSFYRYTDEFYQKGYSSTKSLAEFWLDRLLDNDNHEEAFFANAKEAEIFRAELIGMTTRQSSRKSVFIAIHNAYCLAKNIDINDKKIVVHEHVCFYYSEILEDFVNPNLLMIVRDPRASLAGYFRGFKRKFTKDKPHFFDHYFNMCFDEWFCARQIYYRFRHDENINLFCVKNEDLVADRKSSVTKIAEWLGIPFDESLMHNNSSYDHRVWRIDPCYHSRKTAS